MHAINAGERHLGPGIIRPLSHKPPYLTEKRRKGHTTKGKYTISGGRDTRGGAPMQKLTRVMVDGGLMEFFVL